MKKLECSNCGAAPDEEMNEVEGELFCESCDDDLHRFICDLCEDSQPNEEQADVIRIGIDDSEEFNLSAGYYEILEKPFFISDMFSIVSIDREKLRLIVAETHDDSASSFCKDCIAKLTRQAKNNVAEP